MMSKQPSKPSDPWRKKIVQRKEREALSSTFATQSMIYWRRNTLFNLIFFLVLMFLEMVAIVYGQAYIIGVLFILAYLIFVMTIYAVGRAMADYDKYKAVMEIIGDGND